MSTPFTPPFHSPSSTLYPGLTHEQATELDALSRLMYDMREGRKLLLQAHHAADEATLLEAIHTGRVAEHPGYESYLSARILGDGAEIVRREVAARIASQGKPPAEGETTLHLQLAEFIQSTRAELLAQPPQLAQDALILTLANGTVLTVRFATPDAYSLRWEHAGDHYCIDTAAVHDGLATHPNHLHDPHGRVHPDPVTDLAHAPQRNLAALVDALLRSPSLGHSPTP